MLALAASPEAHSNPELLVRVTQSLIIARPAEMIAVPWSEVAAALPGVHPQKLVVKDGAGHILPYQVIKPDWDAKGIRPEFAELLFQHDFAPGEMAASFTIASTEQVVAPFPAKTYARFVPERLDDFAWENDRIGHRTYGPALAAPDAGRTGKEVLVASGIDVWSKRVSYPVIERFYGRGDYHRDAGEGLDMYKSGTTRGTGGTGVWDGHALHVSGNFRNWKIVANGPIRTVFELGYDTWDANGSKVSEVKRFTVDAGHYLDMVDSTFTFASPKDITIGIGIARKGAESAEYLHPAQPSRLPQLHALAQWEEHKTLGAMGNAIILPRGAAMEFGEDPLNELILAKASSGHALRYYAGAAWTQGGDIRNREDWLAYIANEAARLASPVQVRTSLRTLEPMAAVIERDLALAARQYGMLLASVDGKPGFPRTTESGAPKLVSVHDWTAGFFPGSLWYLAEATGDATLRNAAMKYTAAVGPAKFDKTQHDVGFMLFCSFGNGLRLGAEPFAYRDTLLTGAATLATRFNPKVGAIQSWQTHKSPDWTYPVIIDNMMNLELLMWAARTSHEPYFREIAMAHADTTLKNHFRPDGSSFHLVDYDPNDGHVRSRVTVQGNANDSAWARGQAWGLYGYTMMYRETRKPEYLAQAQKIAAFVMQHPRLPADKVPYWDFDDAAIPNAPRDTAAAAIIASALVELSGFVESDAQRYLGFAQVQLRSLSSPDYLAIPGENGGFLIKHATGHKPAGSEIDVPLNYADYYFLEALLRYRAASKTLKNGV